MGGSDAIRGFMVQALVCLLDALRHDKEWQSLTLEPNRGNTQADFVWHSAGGDHMVQVKSSFKFTVASVRAAAEQLESVEADTYELILASYNFGRVRNGQKFGKVVVRLTQMDAVDLKIRAADALDLYLTDRGYPYTSNEFRKTAAAVLTEYLLNSSAGSRTVLRKELDDLIFLQLLPMLDAQPTSDVAREVREIQEFKALFGYEEPNAHTRRAIMDFYHRTEMKNKHRVIRDAREFLVVDNTGSLAVRIDRLQGLFNRGFFCFAILLMAGPLGATPYMFQVKGAVLFNLILLLCVMSEITGFWWLLTVNPFIQAIRIRREISRLGKTPPFDTTCPGTAL